MDSGTGTSKIKNITRRLFLINVAKVIVFAGILGRLAQLQMAQGTKYSYLSDKNRFREWKIIPPRGIIEDYFGKKLADNSQVFQLHLIPEDIKDENELYFRLKTIIGLSDRQIAKIRNIVSVKCKNPFWSHIAHKNVSSKIRKLVFFILKKINFVISSYRDNFLKTNDSTV